MSVQRGASTEARAAACGLQDRPAWYIEVIQRWFGLLFFYGYVYSTFAMTFIDRSFFTDYLYPPGVVVGWVPRPSGERPSDGRISLVIGLTTHCRAASCYTSRTVFGIRIGL